jgi:hypothetical protein
MYLLFPGRHHLLTDFQFKYINQLIQSGLEKELDVFDEPIGIKNKIEGIVFAVTSANHSNTRRNPVPFYLRALAIQEFANRFHVPSYIFGIDDVGKLGNFASYTLKRILHDSDGMIEMQPENTVVICSTPVMNMYLDLGFKILPAELEDLETQKMKIDQPWDIVEYIATCDKDWQKDKFVLNNMHPASYKTWRTYGLGDKVTLLFSDKIIGEDGDLTATRDYNSYVRQMDEIAQQKYEDVASFIKPGRIGDIGCAVGSWIKLACEDTKLRESDFYGIEVSRHLFDICQQRKHNGEFANPFVFFSQKNAVTGLVFQKGSMDTIFTSSLTHEIESYGGREDLLNFISNRYEELAHNGVWVNRDVVGPENGDEIVYALLNSEDGRNDSFDKDFADRIELSAYMKNLSTYSKFLRFSRDFRRKEGFELTFEEVQLNEKTYIKTSLNNITEFMTKKDYHDNWQSEMHETFCFWSFNDWKQHLEEVGFSINTQSKVFTNNWIADNRWKESVKLFKLEGSKLIPQKYPVTTMFLIAEKK